MKKMRKLSALLALVMFLELAAPLFMQVAEAVAAPKSVSTQTADSKALLTIDYIAKKYNVSPSDILERLNEGYSLKHIDDAMAKNADVMALPATLEQLFPGAGKKYIPATVTDATYGLELPSVTDATYLWPDMMSTFTGNQLEPTSVTESVYSRQRRALRSSYKDEFDKLALQKQHTKLDQAPYSVGNGSGDISTLDGSLNISSTDIGLPGRNGMSFQLTRNYNSNSAEFYEKDVKSRYTYRLYVMPQMNVEVTQVTKDSNGNLVYERLNGTYVNEYGNVHFLGQTFNVFSKEHIYYSAGPDYEELAADIAIDYPADKLMWEKVVPFNERQHFILKAYPHGDGSFFHFENFLPTVASYSGYQNFTVDNQLEERTSLGKGWTWDIPSVRPGTYYTPNYVTLPGGATYASNGSTSLSGYPYDDLIFGEHNVDVINNIQTGYILKYKNGMTYYFAKEGYLIRQEDAYGNFLNFKYQRIGGGHLLTEVSDPLGNILKLEYVGNQIIASNGKDRVVYQKATVPDTSHQYLQSVTDVAGRTTYYNYQFAESKFTLTGGRLLKRNDYALINGIHHPTGSKTVFTYIPIERRLGTLGKQIQYRITNSKDVTEYADRGIVESNQQTIHFDTDPYASAYEHQYKSHVSNGVSTSSFTYKKSDNNTQQIEVVQGSGPVQHITQQIYNTVSDKYPKQVITTSRSGGAESPSFTVNYEYNRDGNVTSETNSLGASTKTTYESGRGLPETITTKLEANQQTFTRIVRNGKGSIIDSKTYANAEGGQLLGHINYEYDGFGNMTKVTAHNDKGKPTVYRYHYGQEYQHGFLTQQEVDVTNVDGQVSTIVEKSTYDPITGRVLSYTDGKQQTTSYAYDSLGRVTLITKPDQNKMTYIYNDATNHIQVKNTLGEVFDVWFDPLGRKVKETEGLGETKYGYDERTSLLQWQEDAYGNRTTYSYDGFGRPTKTTYANNTSDLIEYDDAKQTITTIDAEQNRTRTTTDVLGREVLVETLQNKQNYVPSKRTEYNFANAVTSVTDAKGNRTAYQYDAEGQLTAVTDAENQTTSYSYDRLGNLTETTYANQQKMKKEYDELGRVTKKINETGQVQKYYYDANGNVVKSVDRSGTVMDNQFDVLDRLITNTVANETVQFGYDTEGKRLSMTDHRGTTNYKYQARSGFLTEIQYPDGVKLINNYDLNKKTGYVFEAPGVNVKVNGSYNNVNQLKQLDIVSGNQAAKSITYDYIANGQVAKQSYGSSFVSEYQYEDIKLQQLSHKKDGVAQNTFKYGYDLNRNIVQRTENNNITNFTYTPLNQIQTSSEFNETYSYDERYNRETLDSNRELPLKSAQYEYDKKNRLTKVVGDHNPVTYSYTGEGLLYERIENNVKNRFYYDADKKIIAEAVVGADGKAKVKYVYLYDLAGQLIGRQDAASGQVQYYQLNGHGDVVAIVDETGKKLNEYRYDIWGMPLEEKETVPNILKYSGEYWDKTTGLQYLRARWYDPGMGRFISEDTYEGDITDPLSLNLYTYVANNPLIYIDPSGNVWKWVENGWKLVKTGAKKTFDYFVMDDLKVLIDPKSSFFDRVMAGAGFIPVGKVVKGGKTLIKWADKKGNTKVVESTIKGCNCFTAGTKVLTDEGEKNIEDIKVGDMVLAKDENNPDGELAYKEVTNLYRNQRDDIIKLYVDDQVIETTDNHPFWVEGKGWVFADELEVGDKLQKSDGSNLTINKLEFIMLDEPVTVYNFTVADYHTYYVTDLGIWVHNTDCEIVDVSKYKRWTNVGSQKDWLKEKGYKEGKQYRTDILKTDVSDRNGKKIGEIHYFQKDFNDPDKYVPTHFQFIDPKTGKTTSQHYYFK